MPSRNILCLFFVVLLALTRCGLFEPDQKPGALKIVLVKEETVSNSSDLSGQVVSTSKVETTYVALQKTTETLSSVQCIVKKGSETKYDANLQKNGSNFEGTITGLEPGDYSVLIYGRNSGSEIIARGYRSGITVNADQTATAQVSWSAFTPSLVSPSNGSAFSSNSQGTLDWSDVTGASMYELQISNSSSFASSVYNSNSITVSYALFSNISEGNYYWRVRAQDSSGNWGGWSVVWSFTVEEQQPSISVPPAIDFGSVVLGNSNDQTLRITNSGSATLNITGITSTDAQFSVVGSANFSIAAGSYKDITVRFTPISVGSQSGTLHIANNSSVNPKDVSLSGTGSAVPTPVISAPPSLDFGSVVLGNSNDQTLQITNSGNATLNVTGITSTDTQFSVVGSASFSIAAGSYNDIMVRFTPGSVGSQSGTFHIANNSSVNPKDVSLSGTGTAVPTPIISVSPPSLEFGSVMFGNSSDQKLRITNNGNATLDVTGITSTDAQLSVVGSTSFSITAGSYQDVTIRFAPSSVGVQSGTLHIANNSSVNPKDVSLSGTGFASGSVATPSFNPPPGTYSEPHNITISCSTPDATIHYTINGANPTENDPYIYSGGSITISNISSSISTLKARAYKSGFNPSDVASGMYNIVIDRSGNIWVVTLGGLAQYDGTNWTPYYDYEINDAYSICIDGAGNKWIGSRWDGGLIKFDGTNWMVYNSSNSDLPANSVSSITTDGAGNIWIGAGSNLAKFDGANWTVYNSSNSGLPSNGVNSIAIDGSGNKWIGTEGGGLAKFDGTNWKVYNNTNSDLPGNSISEIAIDGSGNKWMGVWDWSSEGLAKFDGTNWTVFNTSNSGLPSNDVYSIAIDDSENKWIGAGSNLTKFDGANWTVYNSSNSHLSGDYIWSIAIDGLGNKWIGTGNGLAKFDGTNWTVYNTSNSDLPDDTILSIAIVGSGNK